MKYYVKVTRSLTFNDPSFAIVCKHDYHTDSWVKVHVPFSQLVQEEAFDLGEKAAGPEKQLGSGGGVLESTDQFVPLPT